MTTTRKITIGILLGFVGVLITWDVFVVITSGAQQATISEVCLAFFTMHPAATLALGCVLGHLTWPIQSNRSGWVTLVVVAGTALFLLAIDLLIHPPPITPALPLVLGVILGHCIWPQPIDKPPGAL